MNRPTTIADSPTDPILTASEVAAELRCSKAHVYHLLNGKETLGRTGQDADASNRQRYRSGEIIGETDMHVLQRWSPRTVIAYLKHLLRSVPDIGSELSITYSRHTAVIRAIQHEREQELGR